MWRKSQHYLKTNWGAPFVVVFIVLLIVSAALLSAGRSTTSNDIAVYAFYALVLGVVLQIASYIKFGESEQEETVSYTPASRAPPRRWRPGRRTLAVIIVLIVIAGSLGSAIYYNMSSTSAMSSSHTTHTSSTSRTIGHLSAGVNFIVPAYGANNSVQLTIGINETGGVGPYNFTAYWSDGLNQTNDVGVFIRSFFGNQTIPESMKVTVTSSDGQTATVLVQIPSINRTTSLTSSTKSKMATIKFVESGLPSGAQWYLIVNASEYSSNTNQLVLSYPNIDYAKYSVSGPYDQSNFKWAFVPTPQSGSINASSTQVNIAFSNKTVLTPTNQLFILTSPIAAISTGAGGEQLNATYLNGFPDQVQAIVLGSVRNNSTGTVSIATATIEPIASGGQTAILLFSGLLPGHYSIALSVVSPGGVQLSSVTNSTLTITG